MKKLLSVLSSTFIVVGLAQADQVINDDLIVDGSACIGLDCVNGESFGFDTIRIKENNLRIRAVDTSTSASFPTNDWQITFNESSNGGQNKFSIDDIDSGRTPFTIEAGAPAHSLYVEDGGRVGFGTSTPVTDLHVRSGNTPTLRLEQDGSSGFTAQTWDVAGNEANFFIRDVTNGSALPIRLRPGAPSSAIDIAADGDIGFGTSSPEDAVHIRKPAGPVAIRLEAPDGPNPLRLIYNTNRNEFRIRFSGSGIDHFTLNSVGDLALSGGLITGTAGSCDEANPCDGVFDPDYLVPSIESHAEEMWSRQHLPAVGPTRAGEPLNVTMKLMRILNELEKAHIYIEQLHSRIEALEHDDR